MSFWEQLSALITGDLTKEEARVVKQTGSKIVWRFTLALFIAYSMGWLAFVGLIGFARAADIDQKIAPITKRLDNLTEAVTKAAVAQTEQTLQLLRVAIVEAQVKRCHATKDETRTIYRNQVNEAQEHYRALLGQYYPTPQCADL